MIVKKDLIKINDYLWEIPKSFRADMRVPARVYLSEKMLEESFKDRSFGQLINVATLPGIQKYALAMPDMHEGYGFCLKGDVKVLTNLGFYLQIKNFQKKWSEQFIKTLDFESEKITETSIQKFLRIKPKNKVLKIITKSGKEIVATEDHPFYTPNGMTELKRLNLDDKIAVFPFEGVLYKKPSSELIVTEEDLKKTLLKLGRKSGGTSFNQNIRVLKKRGLLSLSYNHPKLPYILKIMGFVFGDASMNFIGKRGDGVFNFAGKFEDLEEARKDLKKIGYTPSPIHFRQRRDSQNGKLRDSYSFLVNASSLIVLLETLGVPRGSKVSQSFRIPKWIFKCPLWQKRLFLAALFGSELRCPHRRLDRRGNFNAPGFPLGKRIELLENAKDYLRDIEKLLKEFGVKVLYIEQPKNKKHISTQGEISWGLNLVISPAMENLLNLWGKIGFEYNQERAFFANGAVQYLKIKQKTLQEKEKAIKFEIPQLLKSRLSYQKIANQLVTGNPLTKRFVIDVCWKLNKGIKKIKPKISVNFPLFGDYLFEATQGLGQSGIVWDEIIEIKEISYKGWVYDFTITNPDHNFIANNFVVSNCIGGVAAMDIEKGVISPGGVGYDINCGVRLLQADLKYEEIKPHLVNLINQIQRDVPSGVGRGGGIKLNPESMKNVLEKGVKWVVAKGYGEKEDIEHCEEEGAMTGAKAIAVSERAKARGRDQLGTLGSGNHFLEVQRVEEIFDEKIAEVFGLFKDQVTVMIHSGSRGLGHQVCTDYVRVMHNALLKYKVKLPDPELACTPFDSPEGQQYFGAMAASANYAWANRQLIMYLIRKAWQKTLGKKSGQLRLIYDLAHNIAKVEEHQGKKVCLHRKGATRAFAFGHPEVPVVYRQIGQPVLIPGTMGTASYILVGTEKAAETFFSVCHGAGRILSRHAAIRQVQGTELRKQLEEKGIVVRCLSNMGLAEEAPLAYKDIHNVVDVVVKAGLAKVVARLRPIGVVKG